MNKRLGFYVALTLLVSGCSSSALSNTEKSENHQPSSQQNSQSSKETSDSKIAFDSRISADDPMVVEYGKDVSLYLDGVWALLDAISAFEDRPYQEDTTANLLISIKQMETPIERIRHVTPPSVLEPMHESILQSAKEVEYMIQTYPELVDKRDPAIKKQFDHSIDLIGEQMDIMKSEYSKNIKPAFPKTEYPTDKQ